MTEGENKTPDSAARPQADMEGGLSSSAPEGEARPLPWFRRPLFWGLLLLLCLLLLAAWLVWRGWRTAEEQRAALSAQAAEMQKRNEAQEAFLQKLRLLLKQDPCDIQRELGALAPPAGVLWPPQDSLPGLSLPENSQKPSAPSTTVQTPAAKPPASVADLLEQATVLILARQGGGMSMGTGFFVAPGYVVTNAHVLGTARQAILINKAIGALLTAELAHSTQSDGLDFAVLKVEQAPAITPLQLAGEVARTERVSAWGFPGAVTGDDPQFSALLKGDITAAPEVVYTDGAVSVILQRMPPLIVHTATVSQGNSGGPLVNARGQVVGINTFIKLDDGSYRQSSLAIVSSSLAAYLRSVGVPFTLAAPTADATQGGNP